MPKNKKIMIINNCGQRESEFLLKAEDSIDIPEALILVPGEPGL